jgi:hypothetical protein
LVLGLDWLNKLQKVAITVLLIIGFNQNLLLYLPSFQQQPKPDVSTAVSCACPPAACMCPPASGCEHKHPGVKEHEPEAKKGINVCRLNSCDQQVIYHASKIQEVPILTRHVDSLVPCLYFAYLDRLPSHLVSQQYLSPPDKPPQA